MVLPAVGVGEDLQAPCAAAWPWTAHGLPRRVCLNGGPQGPLRRDRGHRSDREQAQPVLEPQWRAGLWGWGRGGDLGTRVCAVLWGCGFWEGCDIPVLWV